MEVFADIRFILEDDLKQYRQALINRYQPIKKIAPKTVMSLFGQPVTNLFFLLEGMVKIYTSNEQGYSRLIGFHGPNTLFALDAIIEGANAVVTTEAVTPLKVLSITVEQLEQMGREIPGFTLDLLKYYGNVLRLMCFDSEIQSINAVPLRLYRFFMLYQKSNIYQKNGCILLNQDSIASAINASRVQVARICAEWKKAGWIRIGRGKIWLEDFAALTQAMGAVEVDSEIGKK